MKGKVLKFVMEEGAGEEAEGKAALKLEREGEVNKLSEVLLC